MVRCEECGQEVARRVTFRRGGQDRKVCRPCETDLGHREFQAPADAIMGNRAEADRRLDADG